MSDIVSSPLLNPALNDSVEGAVSHLVDYIGYTTESCVPAMIVEYDRDRHVAKVQPLVKMVYTNGDKFETKERVTIDDVTVLRHQHGAFLIDVPLYKGDTGWLIAADRDTGNVKERNAGETTKDFTENEGPQDPNTVQYHKLHHGFFIPDRWGHIPFKEEYKDHLVIQSMNGKSVIRMDGNGNVEIVGKVKITGSLDVTGEVKSGNIGLSSHYHSYSGTSGDTSTAKQ